MRDGVIFPVRILQHRQVNPLLVRSEGQRSIFRSQIFSVRECGPRRWLRALTPPVEGTVCGGKCVLKKKLTSTIHNTSSSRRSSRNSSSSSSPQFTGQISLSSDFFTASGNSGARQMLIKTHSKRVKIRSCAQ